MLKYGDNTLDYNEFISWNNVVQQVSGLPHFYFMLISISAFAGIISLIGLHPLPGVIFFVLVLVAWAYWRRLFEVTFGSLQTQHREAPPDESDE